MPKLCVLIGPDGVDHHFWKDEDEGVEGVKIENAAYRMLQYMCAMPKDIIKIAIAHNAASFDNFPVLKEACVGMKLKVNTVKIIFKNIIF